MKRIKVTSEEKNSILESHNKYRDVLMGHLFDKSLVSEQIEDITDPKQFLQLAKQRCTNEAIKQGRPATKDGKDALLYRPTEKKVVGDRVVWDSGDEVYFFGDGTFMVTVTQGNKTGIRYADKWSCKGLNVKEDRLNNLIQTLTKGIKEGGYGYFTYDNLPAGYEVPANQGDQTTLEIIQVGPTKLYRPKAATMQPGATTSKESEIIDTYLASFGIEKPEEGRGPWKYENEMTEQERQTWWSGRVMIPKSAGLTKNIVIYLNPSKIDRRQLLKITKDVQKEVKQRYNEKYCGRVIMAYYNAWRYPPVTTKEELGYDFATLEGMKKEVNACLKMDHKYGTLGMGGKDIEKAILALREKYTGDPKFPTLPKSGRDVNRPVVRQLTTPTGEVEYQFDFRLNR
jgi:hypothetical protein